MERIEIINADCVDRDSPVRYPVGYFWIRYDGISFLVGKEYPAFTAQDALDTLADWAPDEGHAPGLMPSEERIAELMADARKDGREDEEAYVEDYYTRAGNASEWIETPAMIEELSELELLDYLKTQHRVHARLSEDGRYIEECTHYSPLSALTVRGQIILEKRGVFVGWEDMAEAVYGPWKDFCAEAKIGDTFELPDGTTCQVMWKPGERH